MQAGPLTGVKNMQIASMGKAGNNNGRWVDFDPADDTVYCRVCLGFGTSQFKSNVCIRNLSHAVKRHAKCAAHQAAIIKCMGSRMAVA